MKEKASLYNIRASEREREREREPCEWKGKDLWMNAGGARAFASESGRLQLGRVDGARGWPPPPTPLSLSANPSPVVINTRERAPALALSLSLLSLHSVESLGLGYWLRGSARQSPAPSIQDRRAAAWARVVPERAGAAAAGHAVYIVCVCIGIYGHCQFRESWQHAREEIARGADFSRKLREARNDVISCIPRGCRRAIAVTKLLRGMTMQTAGTRATACRGTYGEEIRENRRILEKSRLQSWSKLYACNRHNVF